MADSTIKAGDTWPPLRGRAADSDGLLPLIDADSIKIIIKKTGEAPIVEAPVEVIAPPDSDGFNWRYVWQDGDTDELGEFNVEIEITWDNATTPPQVQTIPNDSFQTLAVVDDLGGDR
jgi:hypothetical protein